MPNNDKQRGKVLLLLVLIALLIDEDYRLFVTQSIEEIPCHKVYLAMAHFTSLSLHLLELTGLPYCRKGHVRFTAQ